MNEKQFIDDILLAASIGELGDLVIDETPVRLTVADSLSIFSFYARREFDIFRREFKEYLNTKGIAEERYQMTMRLKSPASILFKALWSGRAIVQIDDIFGFRFLTAAVDDTYQIAEVLIEAYGLADASSPEWEQKEISGFMDWIRTPRRNGFRSLDYFLQTDRGFSLNVQGRTYDMERENEAGLGAHGLYKRMQLARFQVRCFQDADYWKEKIDHFNALLASLGQGYYATSNGHVYTYAEGLSLFVAPGDHTEIPAAQRE